MQEEEFELDEQIAIQDAKRKVIETFETRESELADNASLLTVDEIKDIVDKISVSEPSKLAVNDTLSLLQSRIDPVTPIHTDASTENMHQGQGVTQRGFDNILSPHVLNPNTRSFQPVQNIDVNSQNIQRNISTGNHENVANRDIDCDMRLNSTAKDVNVSHPLVRNFISDYPNTGNDTAGEDAIVSVVQHLKKTPTELVIFDRDPFEYRRFVRQFHSKVVVNTQTDDERLNYLEQFASGEAHKIVTGFSYLPANVGYPAAIKELGDRYGNDEVIANAFVKRTLNWQPIKADNAKALDDFSIFLSECNNAVKTIQAVQVLEFAENMKQIVSKLPFHCHDKWRTIYQRKKASQEPVKFHDLVEFVKTEARKANDPIYGKEAMAVDHNTVKQNTRQHRPAVQHFKGSYATNVSDEDHQRKGTVADTVQPRTKQTDKSPESNRLPVHVAFSSPCLYCTNSHHSLENCTELNNKPYNDKVAFLKLKGLWYGCLKVGHMTKFCQHRASCRSCSGKHPTLLHSEDRIPNDITKRRNKDETRVEKEAIIARASFHEAGDVMGAGDSYCTMAIIPVQVRLRNGLRVVQSYAFLDPGSSVSFCSENLMRKLGGQARKIKTTLDTMTDSHRIDTFALDGIEVCDLDFENVVYLPTVYTKDKMPVKSNHIPTHGDVSNWKHLSDLHIPKIEAGIDLLIGNNVPDAYAPLQIKTGPRGSPHATKSLLGWIPWNVMRPADADKAHTHLVNRLQVRIIEEREELAKLDERLKNAITIDFPEQHTFDDTKQHSQEDMKFLQKVDSSIQLTDGHYEIHLPFRNDQVSLPNNKLQVLGRLKSLERKLQRYPQFHDDYTAFMKMMLDDGYAERVQQSELERDDGKVWFIPHHGVYHPKKPTKLRVVFDCSAKFQGTSLNNLLLQGPNLTNSLIGVLVRFRQERVAIMGDVKAMFHQVKVPREDA